MTPTETQISELHRWFCERTGLQTKLCFAQRLWFEMLRSYKDDADSLRADADLIIRHLKREIARDKRNLGALKLINFLQPDNFDADLAIAKLTHTKATKVTKEEQTRLESDTIPTDDPRRKEAVAGLRALRQSLGGRT